ncbi:MAG: PilZ domain-containing protein [Planctomycetes bacterium]|nr:PilZ domain-containing protein [Planctomycetota bacterium]
MSDAKSPSLNDDCRRADTIRTRLNAPISIVLINEDNERVAGGTANLRDLSLRGAMVTDVRMQEGFEISTDSEYRLRFRLMAGPLAGMEADCRAVRFDPEIGGFGLSLPDGFRLPII